MTRIPYPDPLFVKTYRKAPESNELVEQQLKSRYFASKPDNTPTEQEKKWGITQIDPTSAYWTHFQERLWKVIQELRVDANSNRAVITIDHPQPPCFQSFQFKRNDHHGVDLTCFARSLDLENGLPVDAAIFWRAALERVVDNLALCIEGSSLTVVSPGAHTYKD